MRIQRQKTKLYIRGVRHLKLSILRTLRTVCANLRRLESERVAVAAYREVEALLAAEEKRVRTPRIHRIEAASGRGANGGRRLRRLP